MKKILIVEDHESIKELLMETLGGNNYQFLEANNGETAIRICQQDKPDLIVMDIMMPGEIDGLQAMQIIKQDPNAANCPVILVTAKGQRKDKERGCDAGADAYFIKPFSPIELIRKVEELIE